MWIIIFGLSIILAIASFVYLISRFSRFKLVGRKSIAAVILVLISAILYALIGMINVIICLVHLTVIWLICDAVAFIYGKMCKKKSDRYYCGIVAIAITVVYLSVACFLAYNVSKTEYDIAADKNTGNFKVAMIADSHIGTTFDGKGLEKEIEKINKENPDILVIVGDFVDDDTMREDMVNACNAVSKAKTKYGVYYVYGNHDKGYYGSTHRGYTAEELANTLIDSGVTILEDENVIIDDRICLIGRQDASENLRGNKRADVSELVNEVDSSLYSIVLDHQPADYDNQQGIVDMVLSGHTHGGQMIPITYVGEWIGVNDSTYGLENREETDFIVTSGISDWAIKFKTGCKSEYVIINISEK